MLSRRVSIILVIVVLSLFAGAVGGHLAWRIPAGGIPKDLTVALGRVETYSMFLKAAGSKIDATPGQNEVSRSFDWRDPDLQELIGPVRIVAAWSDSPPFSWHNLGSVCGYLLDHYAPTDSLIAIPGLTTISYQNMHICNLAAGDGSRQYLYVFQLPEPRCNTAALVFAKIPWQYLSTDSSMDAVNAMMESNRGRVFNAVSTSLPLDATCAASMRHLSWAIITLPIGLLLCAGVIFVYLGRNM